MPPRIALRSLLTGVSLLAATLAVSADALVLPGDVPVPRARPASVAGGLDKAVETAAIAPGLAADPDEAAEPADISRLKAGLDALSANSVIKARVIRESLPPGSLDRHILAWAIALKGGPDVPSAEIAETARLLPGWPGMAALRANSEKALYRENPSPRAVVDAFGGTPPQTAEGAIILARSHLALGDRAAAQAVLVPFWRTRMLDAGDETAILREFGTLIPAADHLYRMERMFYAGRAASGLRVAALAGAEPLAQAWAAVIRGDPGAGRLLDAVPAAERGAGYLFARIRYLRRAQKFEDAAALMLKAPRDARSLVDPDEWWNERRALSRELLDLGDARTAYHLAAAHSAESPAAAADAEFHAGWYALTGLHDPAAAAGHFARIAKVSGGAMSLSRAYYWLGRAAEKGGPGDAAAYFRRAADYGMTFYGQLAAERIGRKTIALEDPVPGASDRGRFARREAVEAIRRLQQAGYGWRADILYRDLAQELASPGELALLAGMAERDGNHYMALTVGKIAARRGIDIGALAHPVGVIPATARVDMAGKALAYAVARQESEFNVAAVSAAGARGLLQLLPGTAKAMAKKVGIPYSAERLTSDAGYNATLGSAFLSEQLAKFGGSYVLTIAGYNAGPRRAQEWVAKYGDPRGRTVDAVVDWIERIPYTETRNYVERVMENYEIYKMRLSGHFDIVGDLVNGRS